MIENCKINTAFRNSEFALYVPEYKMDFIPYIQLDYASQGFPMLSFWKFINFIFRNERYTIPEV